MFYVTGEHILGNLLRSFGLHVECTQQLVCVAKN
uniref:Uncharacterized protein n=1 Tax=Anguilla anguilla TaxID=7936 RepID=A0A0E9UZE2_ANGAN